MRVGLVGPWENAGAGIRARQMREILDAAGHDTFVLAQPRRWVPPGLEAALPEWCGEGVTRGSRHDIPMGEYRAWADDTGVEMVLTNQNFQFEALAELRRRGIRTIGRFNWEGFGRQHTEGLWSAYDTVFSLTRAEQHRYRSLFGFDTPFVRWGIHPSRRSCRVPDPGTGVTFFFHGGLEGRRKPIAATIEAFGRVPRPDIRLVIKSRWAKPSAEPVRLPGDHRVRRVVGDLCADDYLDLVGGCHVYLNPTRWEGLGMWIFEALGLGMPIITSDIPPVNEIVRHGVNGLLVGATPGGHKRRGVDIWEPDVADLAACIDALADPGRIAALAASLRADRPRLSWEHTKHDVLDLVEGRLA